MQLLSGLTLPLVTTEEGDKFGKSAGNALWLNPEKTSPFSLYQYFIRTKDSDVERLLKLFTFYTLGEIKDIMHKHSRHPEDRYPQNCLAEQLTTLVHGGNKNIFYIKYCPVCFWSDPKYNNETWVTAIPKIEHILFGNGLICMKIYYCFSLLFFLSYKLQRKGW